MGDALGVDSSAVAAPPVELRWKDRTDDASIVTLGTRGANPPALDTEFTFKDEKKLKKTVALLAGWKKVFLFNSVKEKKNQKIKDLIQKSKDAALSQAWSCKDPEFWKGAVELGRVFQCQLISVID